MHCPACGSSASGKFCAQCGAALPSHEPPTSGQGAYWAGSTSGGGRRNTRRWWPLVAVLAAVVLLGGGGALWALTAPDNRVEASGTGESDPSPSEPLGSGTETQTSDESPTAPSTTTTESATTPSEQDETTSSSSSSDPASPREKLRTLRGQSLDEAPMDGRWAVILSSKYDGIEDKYQETDSGSHVFRLPDILDLHDNLGRQYVQAGDVYLLASEDLRETSKIDHPDTVWMTVLDPGGLDSEDEAQQWCDDNFSHLSQERRANACGPVQLRAS